MFLCQFFFWVNKMKKYIIYKIKNIINEKFYIGSHITEHENDSYMGSGTVLLKAMKKYGKEKFKKDILFIFDNEKEMYDMEKLIVDKTFVKMKDTYNIKIGGYGGWDHIDNTGKTYEELYGEKAKDIKEKISKQSKKTGFQKGKNNINAGGFDVKQKEKISNGLIKYFKDNESIHKNVPKTKIQKEKISKSLKNKNITLSDEHKEKISKANKGKILSEETKNKISKKLKGRIFTPEWRKKLSEAQKRRKRNEKTN